MSVELGFVVSGGVGIALMVGGTSWNTLGVIGGSGASARHG